MSKVGKLCIESFGNSSGVFLSDFQTLCFVARPKKLTPNIKSGSWTFRVRAAVSSLYLRVFMAFIFGLLMSCLEFQTIALQFNLVGLEFLTRKNVFLARE